MQKNHIKQTSHFPMSPLIHQSWYGLISFRIPIKQINFLFESLCHQAGPYHNTTGTKHLKSSSLQNEPFKLCFYRSHFSQRWIL